MPTVSNPARLPDQGPGARDGSAIPDDSVIRFENVSVRYRRPREPVSGLKEYTIRRLQRQIRYEEFWALREASFSVRRGEVLGVIGRNGAGKSTLLKVMARVLYPTSGRIILHGQVAPLLELGGGFHPELTGRENIFLNMALLGHNREETEALLDEIIAFAEIEDFINAPLRTYSTGMAARLGFSVATCVRPDILLIDEVLSVGDSRFQEKCLDRMYSFQSEGTTIVFVSHSMGTVESFCDQVIWLDEGRIRASGSAAAVIDQYLPPDPARENPLYAAAARPALQFPAVSASALQTGYASLGEAGKVYPAEGIFNIEAGTLTTWLRLERGIPGEPCALFHSDDSRYVLYIAVERGSAAGQAARTLVARAGGNRKAFDPASGAFRFPEVSAPVGAPIGAPRPAAADGSFPEGVWRLVTLVWQGYPRGAVRLYLGADSAGEAAYDRRHDNGSALPSLLSVGMRPAVWSGELAQQEDGSLVDLRPGTLLAVPLAGLELKDMRLYPRALSPEEIAALAARPALGQDKAPTPDSG